MLPWHQDSEPGSGCCRASPCTPERCLGPGCWRSPRSPRGRRDPPRCWPGRGWCCCRSRWRRRSRRSPAATPDAGGVATFAARAFGPRWAAVTGWWFYCSVPVGVPVLGLFGGAYVAAATGGGRTTALAVGVALVAVAVAANWIGLRLSGRLQLTLAALLAALLAAAIAASAPHARTTNLYPFAPHGWYAVGGAATLLVWSFAGWEAVTHLAAEFADPARDLRRATAASLTLIGALYLGLAAVSVLVLGPRLEQVDAPLAVLLAHGISGSVSAGTIAAVVAVVVTLATMNAYVASAARLGVALGRDGALPGWLTKGGRAGEVPRRSLATWLR